MSRTGARDKARRELSETMAILNEAVLLIGKSRSLLKRLRCADAVKCMAMIDEFYYKPIPAQCGQHSAHMVVEHVRPTIKKIHALGHDDPNGIDKRRLKPSRKSPKLETTV